MEVNEGVIKGLRIHLLARVAMVTWQSVARVQLGQTHAVVSQAGVKALLEAGL